MQYRTKQIELYDNDIRGDIRGKVIGKNNRISDTKTAIFSIKY